MWVGDDKTYAFGPHNKRTYNVRQEKYMPLMIHRRFPEIFAASHSPHSVDVNAVRALEMLLRERTKDERKARVSSPEDVAFVAGYLNGHGDAFTPEARELLARALPQGLLRGDGRSITTLQADFWRSRFSKAEVEARGEVMRRADSQMAALTGAVVSGGRWDLIELALATFPRGDGHYSPVVFRTALMMLAQDEQVLPGRPDRVAKTMRTPDAHKARPILPPGVWTQASEPGSPSNYQVVELTLSEAAAFGARRRGSSVVVAGSSPEQIGAAAALSAMAAAGGVLPHSGVVTQPEHPAIISPGGAIAPAPAIVRPVAAPVAARPAVLLPRPPLK